MTVAKSTAAVKEADNLTQEKRWRRAFTLSIMFCRAQTASDKKKANICMELLIEEVKHITLA
jgi:hypothetical protein